MTSKMYSIRRSHSPIQLLLLTGESVGNRTVVGQQSQDRDKDIRPSNTDVAGLPGGIKDLGSRSANEGFSRSCLLIDICLSTRKVAAARHYTRFDLFYLQPS